MKRNEIIELNGKEYTLELNRDSFLQIDKICNIEKSMEIIKKSPYEYVEEIDDDYNPFEDAIDDEKFEKTIEDKETTLRKLVERSFFIWLYPNHKLTISQVKEIVAPYLEGDDEKANFIGEKLGYYLQECVSMREAYNEERKNLKAQVNKK
jgi:hypothetical protein